jgi:hypothetical protein
MNNICVAGLIKDCEEELDRIEKTISTNPAVYLTVTPYLTAYTLIKACGTSEFAFKKLIYDALNPKPQQMDAYFQDAFMDRGMGPTVGRICAELSKFDADWEKEFNSSLRTRADYSQLCSALKSLVKNRNQMAHGGSVTITLNSVKEYFLSSKVVLEMLDKTVSPVL